MAIQESCKAVPEDEWNKIKDTLKKRGCKKRNFSYHPDSLGCPLDRDRILHVIPKKENGRIRIMAEIESNPARHPIEHLISQNGFSKPGACARLEGFLKKPL